MLIKTKAVRRVQSRPFDPLWWLNPIWPFSLILLATGIAAYLIPASDYLDSWKTPKYLGASDLEFLVLSVCSFVLSALFVNAAGGPFNPSFTREIENNPRLPWPIFWAIFYISVTLVFLAYVIWLAVSVVGGLSISDIVSALHNNPDATYVIHDKTETVPGVTTFTQLAMALFLLGIILGFKFGWRKNWLALGAPMGVILFLTTLRAHFRDERLALIEIGVPSVILCLALAKTEKWPAQCRVILGLLPLGAPLVLYIFFSAAEYSRSWVNFYQGKSESSFLMFSFNRLVGYYVTALNNGAAFVQSIGQYEIPFHSLEFFWKFPIIKDLFRYQSLSNAEPWDDYRDLLKQKLNPELNNPSGIFVVQLDYGFFGGIMAWSLAGLVAMLLYRSFRKGKLTGLLLYPFFYIGLLEASRILYWTTSRALPTWLLILAILSISSVAAHGEWQKRIHRSRNLAVTSTTLFGGKRRRKTPLAEPYDH